MSSTQIASGRASGLIWTGSNILMECQQEYFYDKFVNYIAEARKAQYLHQHTSLQP